MKNLYQLAKSVAEERNTGWISGPPHYEIVHCKCNIYRQNQNRPALVKKTVGCCRHWVMNSQKEVYWVAVSIHEISNKTITPIKLCFLMVPLRIWVVAQLVRAPAFQHASVVKVVGSNPAAVHRATDEIRPAYKLKATSRRKWQPCP